MRIWGIHKKYPSLSWWENFKPRFISGHLSIGPITIYGDNAMDWAVNIRTKWGYLCFTLPALTRFKVNRRGQRWIHWYVYLSPNGTPWACTFYMGYNRNERLRAKIRRLNFGHGFSTQENHEKLRTLNNKYDRFHISEREVFEFQLTDSQEDF